MVLAPWAVDLHAHLGSQNPKAILDIMVLDELDETGENFLRLILGRVFHYFEQPGCQGQMLQHAVSATVSLLRISAVSTSAGWIRVSVSVRSAGPLSGCQRVERGNRELVPHGRVIYARNRSRQRRSQEMSVRALRRVAHQDGLAGLKTLYAACVR